MADVLKLETNKPTEISLKYRSGKEVSGQYGPQVMYSLSDGRVLYLPPEAAQQISALNPKPGESLVIVKAIEEKKAVYRVERLPQPKGARPAAMPAPTPGQKEYYLSRACALIDVFAAAHEYSTKTYNGTLSKEDVRALVTTVFIQLTPRPGGR